MTDDSIALRELLEKSADADLLREMIGFAAERLMELEVQRLAGFFRRYELYLVVGDERERAFRLDGVAHPDACR